MITAIITTIVTIPLTKSVGSEIARLCNSSEKEIAIKKPKNTNATDIAMEARTIGVTNVFRLGK